MFLNQNYTIDHTRKPGTKRLRRGTHTQNLLWKTTFPDKIFHRMYWLRYKCWTWCTTWHDIFSCVGVATLKANSPDERNTQPGHRNNNMQNLFAKHTIWCDIFINVFLHVIYIFWIWTDIFWLCVQRYLHLNRYILGLHPDMGGPRGDAWTPTPRWASEHQISHICHFWICQLTNTNAKS